jgi:pimeloyl-ACP methyl ester carboxylesterase
MNGADAPIPRDRLASLHAALDLALLLFAVVGLAGCIAPLGPLIVTAPNQMNPLAGKANPLPPVESLLGTDQHFWVDVGPPAATLSVSVMEPDREAGPPKGTVLVIHGIYARSLWMLGTARMLAGAGYRAVLVDLRGQGRSSGKWLTYGIRESRDLSQVIDALEDRGLVSGRLGVYGISYGATTAIELAGRDPRIAAVVAVAPFSTMRAEVPHYIRTILPGAGAAISDETCQEAIDEAGEVGGFNPDVASAVAAIRRTRAPVLILHGTNDWMVPPWHAVRLRDAAPDRTRLVLIPWLGHITIWFDPTGEVAAESRAWFDRHLAGEGAGP